MGRADSDVGLALGDQLEQERTERLGDGQVVLAEADEHVVAAVGDLIEGHGGDSGLLLAEQQQEAAGDPVDDGDAVVVQQRGDLCPALVGVGGESGGAFRDAAAKSL